MDPRPQIGKIITADISDEAKRLILGGNAQSSVGYLGSVDISLQLDNREMCTDTWSFVGVGSPNPLFTRQSPFRNQGRFRAYAVPTCPRSKTVLQFHQMLYLLLLSQSL